MAARSAQKREESNARSALIWGSLAFCSILAVCVMIALRIGTNGGEFATAKINTTPPPAKVAVQKPQGASEFEVARLKDAIQALAAERDRLAARVDTLEQSVGDITASINTAKKPAAPSADAPAASAANNPAEGARAPEAAAPAAQASPPVPPAPPMAAQPAPSAAPPPAAKPLPYFAVTDLPGTESEKAEKASAPPSAGEGRTPARSTPVGKVERPGLLPRTAAPRKTTTAHRPRTVVKTAPAAPTPIPPPRPEAAAGNGPSTQIAKIMPLAAPAASDVTGATRTEFGIDLGGETSLDGLRARWAKLRDNHAQSLQGMQPLVRVREGSRPGTVELHLIAGPLANAGTAARVCAQLQSTGIACQASEYDGQRLPAR